MKLAVRLSLVGALFFGTQELSDLRLIFNLRSYPFGDFKIARENDEDMSAGITLSVDTLISNELDLREKVSEL